ncbi:MAG: hypothetical protein JNK15_10755 [Planctomycetes bacterium]|nr:hypothetical protein [Planctomycetota bacterium]
MAIIVTHVDKGGRFVVLGASVSKWATSTGHVLFGDLAPVEKSGVVRSVAVCGADGKIQFADADQLRVVSIDGKTPQELLGGGGA